MRDIFAAITFGLVLILLAHGQMTLRFLRTYWKELLIALCIAFALEITRRGFGTVSCYLDLKYNPVSFYCFGLWEECVERIWLFPFYL